MDEEINNLSDELQTLYYKLCMNVDTSIDINSVILSLENQEKIKEFIVETENKEKFIKYGLTPVNRILMYGASGTGKTYLTKALANYFGYTMFYIDISSALASGVAAQSLKEIFMIANKIGKAIIFLDECDSICWARDDSHNNDDAAIRRANNTLFQLLDQMNPMCIFVAATNLYKNLDPAFVRRFNTKMEFVRPAIEEFDNTVQKFLNSAFTYISDVDREIKSLILEQAKSFKQISYAQIKDWVERVEKDALINNTLEISEAKVYKFLLAELRIEVKTDNGKRYLYQYGENNSKKGKTIC